MMKTVEVEERDDDGSDYAPLVEHEDVVLFWNNRQVCYSARIIAFVRYICLCLVLTVYSISIEFHVLGRVVT